MTGKKVFGFDLGVASIGWAVLQLNDSIQFDTEKEKYFDTETGEIFDKKPGKILAAGVRCFMQSVQGSKQELLNLQRRSARLARRRNRRRALRMKELKELFIKHGLVTEEELKTLYNSSEVWDLRIKALDELLTGRELAKVLTHMAKHRGFKSYRKEASPENMKPALQNNSEDNSEEANKAKETEAVKKALRNNEASLKDSNYRTMAEMIVNRGGKKRNGKEFYNNSISREDIRSELELIFKKQQELKSNCFSQELYQKLAGHGIESDSKSAEAGLIFRHRPIKGIGEMVGDCLFEKDEKGNPLKRAPKAAPSSELFIALGKIKNLRLFFSGGQREALTLQEQQKLLELFFTQKEVSYQSIRQKILTEREKFEFLGLNETKKSAKAQANALKKAQKEAKEKGLPLPQAEEISPEEALKNAEKNRAEQEKSVFYSLKTFHEFKAIIKEIYPSSFELFLPDPTKFTDEVSFKKEQEKLYFLDEITTITTIEKDPEKIKQALKRVFGNFTSLLNLAGNQTQEQQLLEKFTDLSFSKFINLSLKALYKLSPLMIPLRENLNYNEACDTLGWDHTKQGETLVYPPAKILAPLKPDKQTNVPTVNRTLAQFRKVYNAVVREYGEPDQINIELARELNHSARENKKIKEGQEAFKSEKDKIAQKAQENSIKSLDKLRLYEQQGGKCLYSGQALDLQRLDEPHYCEIDHIIPYSRCFDDSLNNKALCLHSENQKKSNLIPAEYLRPSDKWAGFVALVNSLPNLRSAKKQRLLKDSWTSEDEEKFKDRNLNDTRYMSRFVLRYLKDGIDFKASSRHDIKNKVQARNGALTDYLRHQWGFPKKDRNENDRHHALDAIIVACADQGMVQRLNTIAGNIQSKRSINGEAWYKNMKKRVKQPWEGFREEAEAQVNMVFVSRPPRKRVKGELHKETIQSESSIKRNLIQKLKKEATKQSRPAITKGEAFEEQLKNEKNKLLPIRGGFADKGEPIRIDIYLISEGEFKGEYKFVPIYGVDLNNPNFKPEFIPNNTGRKKSEPPKPEPQDFRFSLCKDDLIWFKSKKAEKGDFHYVVFYKADGRWKLKTKDGSNPYTEKEKPVDSWLFTVSKGDEFKKYSIDVLGKISLVKQETLLPVRRKIKQAQPSLNNAKT